MSTMLRAPRDHRPLGRRCDLFVRILGAVLALGVAAVHVKDQGGFPGDKTPTYVGLGYYALEAAGVLVALGLLVARGRARAACWLLAAGVAAGPVVGIILSRGPGLPDYSDDKGNWTESLVLWSLALEIPLLILAVARARAART